MLNTNKITTNVGTAVNDLANQLQKAQHAFVITGAGISVPSGIPDLKHLSTISEMSLSSETSLESNPKRFYYGFHQIFLDPIFNTGPTASHDVIAQLEQAGYLNGVITTNVDYLHELAGSRRVADIWSSLNINHCLACGKTFPINVLNQELPVCPVCGGIISPDPIYQHIAIKQDQYAKANAWMDQADLVITVGSNGYYSNINDHATVININNGRNHFDRRANLSIRSDANTVFEKLAQLLK